MKSRIPYVCWAMSWQNAQTHPSKDSNQKNILILMIFIIIVKLDLNILMDGYFKLCNIIYCQVHPACHWAETPARPTLVIFPSAQSLRPSEQPDLWGSGWLQQPRSAGAVASCRPLFYGELGNNPKVSYERNKTKGISYQLSQRCLVLKYLGVTLRNYLQFLCDIHKYV